MSPALNGSSTIRRFEGRDAIEIRDGKTDFYTGLPHYFPLKYKSCVASNRGITQQYLYPFYIGYILISNNGSIQRFVQFFAPFCIGFVIYWCALFGINVHFGGCT